MAVVWISKEHGSKVYPNQRVFIFRHEWGIRAIEVRLWWAIKLESDFRKIEKFVAFKCFQGLPLPLHLDNFKILIRSLIKKRLNKNWKIVIFHFKEISTFNFCQNYQKFALEDHTKARLALNDINHRKIPEKSSKCIQYDLLDNF